MKRKITFVQKENIFNFSAINKDTAVLYVPPVYEFMLVSELTTDNSTCTQFVNDVYLLFNQERLRNSVGSDTFNQIIDSFKSHISNDDREFRKNISDEQLSEFVKSRHYQSPNELKTWTHYLSENFDYEYNKYMSKRAKEVERLEKEAKEKRDKELEEYLKRKNANV